MTTIRAFYAALTAQENAFAASLATDNYGIALRAAINELDWYYYNLTRAEAPTSDQHEEFYILKLGATRLISLALKARASYDVPVVMFPRTREITLRALTIVSAIGMIQHGRRMAQTLALGTGTIEQTGPGSFVIRLPADIPDQDHYERAVIEHYNAFSRRLWGDLLSTDKVKSIESDAEKLLRELVYPYETHFIGYGADPLLDDYFFVLAYQELTHHEGADTFHPHTRFRDIPFRTYILGAAFLLSTARKHERFAEALIEKEPSIKLVNVLTISADIEPFAESVMDAVNRFGTVYENFEDISLDQARFIIDVLSIRRDNTTLIDPPGAPLPMLVQCSDTGMIKTLAGAQSEPMAFLLDSLRHHCRKDYDTNQQTREAGLQSTLEHTFASTFKSLTFQRNVVLRSNGRDLTDIDLVVTEPSTGLVILCQVKHQELYGANIHSKRIRAERLRSQVSSWLASLDTWEGSTNMATLRQRLSLGPSFPKPVVHRMVVTRHYAYPLKDLENAPDLTFGTWPQVLNEVIALKNTTDCSTIGNLLERLTVLQGRPIQTHLEEPPTKWTVGSLTFEVHQADSLAFGA